MSEEAAGRPRFARAGFADFALLVGRALLAYLFVTEGAGKIAGYAPVQDYMTQYGVAPALLPLVILLELGGGLAVAAGLATRAAACALAAFCILTALLFHLGGDAASVIEFRKNLALCGGLLALAARGGGALALDAFVPAPAWRRRRMAGDSA